MYRGKNQLKDGSERRTLYCVRSGKQSVYEVNAQLSHFGHDSDMEQFIKAESAEHGVESPVIFEKSVKRESESAEFGEISGAVFEDESGNPVYEEVFEEDV
ncbi:unnamed protein product, partial [Gongylonema pulchrum]|uniref:DUF1508 domain-containing protein n=1 Tax=Gongylonema pulchrum TaxID=637853 RepID=A0A183DI00_9BILA